VRPPSKPWALVVIPGGDPKATPIERRRFWTEGAAHNWRDKQYGADFTPGWFEVRPVGDLRPCEEVWREMFEAAIADVQPGEPCPDDPDGLHFVGCGCEV
jgi:hypothetical protein